MFFVEVRLHEAGYFYAISKKSQLKVNLVQLSEQKEDEDKIGPISRAMDDIDELEPDVVLLYSNKENIELMLQQVIRKCIFFIFSFCSTILWYDIHDIPSFYFSYKVGPFLKCASVEYTIRLKG